MFHYCAHRKTSAVLSVVHFSKLECRPLGEFENRTDRLSSVFHGALAILPGFNLQP